MSDNSRDDRIDALERRVTELESTIVLLLGALDLGSPIEDLDEVVAGVVGDAVDGTEGE